VKLHTSVVGWFSLFSENHQFLFLDKLFNFISSVFKLKITGQGISFLENKIQLVLSVLTNLIKQLVLEGEPPKLVIKVLFFFKNSDIFIP
jgi:hypothetical protein